jgi:hypothetical protein
MDDDNGDSDYGGGGGGGVRRASSALDVVSDEDELDDMDDADDEEEVNKEFYGHMLAPQKDRFEAFASARLPPTWVRRVISEVVAGPKPTGEAAAEDGGAADEDDADGVEDADERPARRGGASKGSAKVGRPVLIAMGGIGKVLAAELTEEARAVMAERGDDADGGPIRPEHIVEAHRRLAQRSTITFQKPTTSKLFTH